MMREAELRAGALIHSLINTTASVLENAKGKFSADLGRPERSEGCRAWCRHALNTLLPHKIIVLFYLKESYANHKKYKTTKKLT